MDTQLCHSGEEESPICLDELNVTNIKILPCKHKFHSLCIDEWIKRKNICPLCRFPLTINYKCKDVKKKFFIHLTYNITINDDTVIFKNWYNKFTFFYKKMRYISYKDNIFNINYYKNNSFVVKSFKFETNLMCENFFKLITNKFELQF